MMGGQNHCDPQQPFPRQCPFVGAAKIQHLVLARRNPQGCGVACLEAGLIWDYIGHPDVGDKGARTDESPVLAGVASCWLVPEHRLTATLLMDEYQGILCLL